jgi:hypothetical protein
MFLFHKNVKYFHYIKCEIICYTNCEIFVHSTNVIRRTYGLQLAPLQNLIDQFERMQGVGHKTAQRMAFYVLGLPRRRRRNLQTQ